MFSLLFKASSVSVPLGQLSVSGNPSAIMLFYRAVRGGCLETAALSCPDNISLCVVHHTPTYLSLGQIAPAELENFERLHNCSFGSGPSGLRGLSRREKIKTIFCPLKSLVKLFVKLHSFPFIIFPKKIPDICALSTQLDKGEFLSFLKFGQS